MSQYVDLAASATSQVYTFDGFVPEKILLDNIQTANPCNRITVTIGGENYQELTDQAAITAFSRWLANPVLEASPVLGNVLKIAPGQIDLAPGQQCRITLGNATASDVDVYASSSSNVTGTELATPFRTAQNSINAQSNTVISGVDVLIFPDTNFEKALITFADGHSEADMTLQEINALFAELQGVDASGKLGTYNAIDFERSGIVEVKLFAASGGSLSYYTGTL